MKHHSTDETSTHESSVMRLLSMAFNRATFLVSLLGKTAASLRYLVVVMIAGLMISACHKAATTAAPAVATAETSSDSAVTTNVVLEPDVITHMGITTEPVTASRYTDEQEGYGMVLSHDAIAQIVADVSTAEAAAQQSRAALARMQRLADTPGALPLENAETATRQAAADAAALSLAQRRLSASFGQHPSWQDTNGVMLAQVASGQAKLVRVTFPLGTLNGTAPNSLRIARLDPNSNAVSWQATRVWTAPADTSIPGRSFFALLTNDDLGEGEHVQAWANVGTAESGVVLPARSIVISESKYWCFIEKPAGTFTLTEIDASKPIAAGYFVKQGVVAGDRVVVSNAGLLLARYSNPSTAAE